MTQCPVIRKNGMFCDIPGEVKRLGFCHIHDPRGAYYQQHRESILRTARVRSEKRKKHFKTKEIERLSPRLFGDGE